MNKIKRLILLNQMAGPLFREVAEGIAPHLEDGCLLYTGHPDTLKLKSKVCKKLEIRSAPIYNRSSNINRIISWIKYVLYSTHIILKSKRTDSFMIVSNPPILGAWFWILNKIKKRSYCVLVYDIHPDVLIMMGKVSENNIIVKLWRWINYKVYRDANCVITLGNHMAKRLYKQFPQNAKVPEVIPPWANTDIIKPIDNKDNKLLNQFNPNGKKVVLYSGNMGGSHDIDSMLEAAKILREHDDILFLFIGSGEKWQYAIDFMNEYKMDNLKVYPFQPEDNLPYTMALSSISLVALDVGAEELMVPSKVFYYMSVGSAIIGVCQNENELKDIIQNGQCGICVEPKQPKELANTILKLFKGQKTLVQYQQNARNSAVEYYSKEVGIKKFLDVLKSSGII